MIVFLDPEQGAPEQAVGNEAPETILKKRSNSQVVLRAIDDLPVHAVMEVARRI